MTLGTRRIMVDDADTTAIQYHGTWTTENGAHDAVSDQDGPTFDHTQHGTTSNGASISFAFNGSSIQVLGSWDQNNNETLPEWACFVDNNEIESQRPFLPSSNQNPLCWEDDLDGEGEHTLTVNITVNGTVDADFWLDFIAFTPYASDLWNDTTMWLAFNDSAVTYSGGWEDNSGSKIVTATNASLSAKFNGTNIRMVGPIQNASSSSSAGFRIDGGDYTTFTVNKVDPTYDVLWSQTLFESPDLDGTKEHTIDVQWYGDPATDQRFGIENFYIQTPLVSNQTSNPQSPTQSHNSVPLAAVIGGAVGGAVLICSLVGIWWLWRRRNRYSSLRNHSDFDLTASPVTPFQTQTPSATPSERKDVLLGTPSPVYHLNEISGLSSSRPVLTQSSDRGSLTATSAPDNLLTMKNEQALAVNRREIVSSTPSTSSSSSTTKFVKHQDSGLRLPQPETEPEVIVDLPPDYQAS